MKNIKIEEKPKQFAMLNDPVSYVLTVHFSNMSKTYGNRLFRNYLEYKLASKDFLPDITVLFVNNMKNPSLQRHINNLFATYGKEKVALFYKELYK